MEMEKVEINMTLGTCVSLRRWLQYMHTENSY